MIQWLRQTTNPLSTSTPIYTYMQSLHVTLVHRESGVTMEVQLRSLRMHLEAEYGGASHNRYKAMLPSSVDKGD